MESVWQRSAAAMNSPLDQQALNPVKIPERTVYPPLTISAAARANLSAGAALPRLAWPDPADASAWRQRISERDGMWRELAEAAIATARATLATGRIADVTCHIGTPPGGEGDGAAYLYFHGGAFVFGGGDHARMQAVVQADRLGLQCISVDYRMPPDHPFPAAPEDGIAVYQALLEKVPPGRIVIGGSSAGGNLAAAVTLMIRDRGLPLPAGVVLLTPEVDLTEAGDTNRTNALLDTVLKGPLPECNALYAAGTPLDHPYLSPLFADLSGFPPTFVQSGTRDLFLSNSVLFHRKLRAAGVRAELHVWEAMPHGGFGGATPEDAEIADETRRFVAGAIAG
jgi:acetyl esterase/lipase